jgi:LysR family transcriptional regulator, regulator for metE and metH
MLHLEMKHLRLVVTIAEIGNLTRAAHTLCLSQPALSKQLAELEAQLGFALFHRTRKAMCLTEPGRGFRRHAERILADVGTLEAELTRYGNGTLGKLRLSIDRVHHSPWLPAVMAQFRKRHPRIELEIKHVPDLLCSLQQRDIDVAIVGEVVDAAGVDYLALHEDELVAVLPLTHPLRQKDCISVHDLAGVTLLYYFGLEQSYLYRRYLQPNRIEVASFHHIENVDAIIELVKSGEGMSILPARLVQDALRACALDVRPIGPNGFGFTWYAALSSDADHPYATEFVQLLQSTVAQAEVLALA